MADFIKFLLKFLPEYFTTVLFNWFGLILAATAFLDLVERVFEKKPKVPASARVAVMIFVFLLAQISAYRDLKEKYETTTNDNVRLQEKLKTDQLKFEQRKVVSKNELPSIKQNQSNIKQESKGDSSPNIVGNNNQVNSPVIINPEKGWRKLTNQEVSDAVSQLTPFAGLSAKIQVEHIQGFPDDSRLILAGQIENILKQAKWEVKVDASDIRIYSGIPKLPRKVFLLTRERTTAAETLGKILSNLLGKNNFSGHVTDQADDKYNVEIRVWSKPE